MVFGDLEEKNTKYKVRFSWLMLLRGNEWATNECCVSLQERLKALGEAISDAEDDDDDDEDE